MGTKCCPENWYVSEIKMTDSDSSDSESSDSSDSESECESSESDGLPYKSNLPPEATRKMLMYVYIKYFKMTSNTYIFCYLLIYFSKYISFNTFCNQWFPWAQNIFFIRGGGGGMSYIFCFFFLLHSTELHYIFF